MRWSVLLIPLLVAVLSGCATNKVATTVNVDTPAVYTLDTGDVVRVTVYGDETLTNTYTVTDKGTIAFPLAGQVQVRGQSITTAERMITELLANGYMISPKVSVEVTTYRPFFIEGAVGTAGQYAYVYGMIARAAVATAGGFAEFADKGSVSVYRKVGKTVAKLKIGLDEPILPGDTIVVRERWL
ncbi:MAG: polysaccharide export protein [Hyphomicrobiales bacterium]|nr:MAG: polysaccharide export protein [Hyphomicrobiales bacterium]